MTTVKIIRQILHVLWPFGVNKVFIYEHMQGLKGHIKRSVFSTTINLVFKMIIDNHKDTCSCNTIIPTSFLTYT